MTARHPLYRLAAREVGGMPPQALSARRSVFERHGEPLMVTECFLPALWTHLASLANAGGARRSIALSVDSTPAGHPRLREHGRPIEHTASRAHPATRAASERSR